VHQTTLTTMQKAVIRTFNCALREMKNGALCAFVDANQSQLRQMPNNGHRLLGAIASQSVVKYLCQHIVTFLTNML
jgi:hypothetical protein